jgi:hypothetical protein
MKLAGRQTSAGLALAVAASPAAFAEGPGKYAVSGINVKDKSEYHGSATLTRTGPMTWEVVENIGVDTLEGFGVGDGKTIAVSFANDGSTVVVLYTANSDGSYTGMWAEEGDKDVSTETLKPQ